LPDGKREIHACSLVGAPAALYPRAAPTVRERLLADKLET
jgi:hypothetical protein